MVENDHMQLQDSCSFKQKQLKVCENLELHEAVDKKLEHHNTGFSNNKNRPC